MQLHRTEGGQRIFTGAAELHIRALNPCCAHLSATCPQPEDYEETKREFLSALAGGIAPASTAGSNGAAAAAAKPPQPPPKPVSWSIPPPAPPREQLQQQAAAAAAPPAAAPQQAAAPAAAAPVAAAPPPTAAAAAAALAAPAAAPARQPMHRVPSNPDVPTNIPKMGGIKQLSQGVS